MKGPTYFNGKRNIGGTAAWIHTISQNGGWFEHHDNFIKDFIAQYTEHILESTKLKRVK